MPPTCDICGRDRSAKHLSRFVVKIEPFTIDVCTSSKMPLSEAVVEGIRNKMARETAFLKLGSKVMIEGRSHTTLHPLDPDEEPCIPLSASKKRGQSRGR